MAVWGVALSPRTCRVVAVARPPWRSRSAGTRVRAFASWPRTSPAVDDAAAILRRRRVHAVIWGVRCRHVQMLVRDGPYESVRAEALAQFSASSIAAGLDVRRALADVTPVGPPAGRGASRRILLVVADAGDVRAAIKPLTDAGADLRAVFTPALALMSLARSRRALLTSETTEAYVALDETRTALALVRGGVLLTAREVEWGYLHEVGARSEVQQRQAIASRVADELSSFLAATPGSVVSQVCICGGLPELRTMTVPLMERLDVEVETLDSLFAIDATRLPAPGAAFRDQAAALRLAWAVAADRPAPIDLLRDERRLAARASMSRAAVVAMTAVGLGAGWAVWRSVSTPSVVSRPAEPIHGVASDAAPVRPGSRTTMTSIPTASRVPEQVASVSNESEQARMRPIGHSTKPRSVDATVVEDVTKGSPIRPEPTLESILYATDRKLAIIDGQIVEEGDQVEGGIVSEITPEAVSVRDPGGRVKRLVIVAIDR